MARQKIIHPDNQGEYRVSLSYSAVTEVNVSDVDIVVRSSKGTFVLPDAAYKSMLGQAPVVKFSDRSVTSDTLFREIGEVHDLAVNNQIYKSGDTKEGTSSQQLEDLQQKLLGAEEALKRKDEEIQKQKEVEEELQAQQEEIKEQQEQIEEIKEKLAAAEAEIKAQGDEDVAKEHDETINAPESTQEASVSKYNEEMKKIIEEVHSKDYDYAPPSEFSPPPQAYSGPPGVPAPLSMTPLVTLSMGNAVGTESSGSNPTRVYGGGGATGSDALSKIGPRDALQFSAATIDGTAGDDVIRAEGPLVGNADPAADTSNYAKEFLLSVAGYFSSLDDVVFRGIPDFVSVSGATKQADGSWVLPSDYALYGSTFTLVYDKDAWRAEPEAYFDMTVEVSGEMKNAPFSSEDTFRLMFMDVTDVSQVTDPTLTAWLDSQTKQVYVLPTLDQPNIINHGEGNDIVYGGLSHDTITGGDGDNEIYGYAGDDVITQGHGTNTIDAGNGENTITVGDGNNNQITSGTDASTIVVGDGDGNTITVADGANNITVGDGDNNTVNLTAGDNTVVLGTGTGNAVNAGAGNDTITISGGAGTNIIDAGDGDNAVYIYGTGTNTASAGTGTTTFYTGLGQNTFSSVSATSIVNYSLASTGLTIDMQAATAIDTATGGTAVSDNFAGITTVRGSDHGDTITGNNAGTIIYGGNGVNTITGGTGVDQIYAGSAGDTIDGGGGADFLYGGAGDDTFINPIAGVSYDGHAGGTATAGEMNLIDYSAENTNLTIDLATGIGYGGAAEGSTYEDITHIIGGSNSDTITASDLNTHIEGGGGNDVLTGGDGDDIIDGGSGSDDLRGGAGNNVLIGGSSDNDFYMGVGADRVEASIGNWDKIRYYGSPTGVVMNFDTVDRTFVDQSGTTRTIAALSGGSNLSATDQLSWGIGDTYMDEFGAASDFEMYYGSRSRDTIIGNSHTTEQQRYYGEGGLDTIIGSSNTGIDYFYNDWGGNYIDGVNGATDIFYLHASHGIQTYLDVTADIDGNGRADYIDRGVSDLQGYTGMSFNWGSWTYLKNVHHLYGGRGNDTMVGDHHDNFINASSGVNLVYGLGGNDTFILTEGSDTIDGGSGTDTVSFIRQGVLSGFGSDGSQGFYAFLSNDTTLNGINPNSWGTDAQVYTQRSGIDLYSKLTSIENIDGSHYDDVLAGNSGANVIEGNNGDDWITGNGGADTLRGNNNNDTILVKASDVASIASADGGSGTNTLMLTPDNDGGAQYTFTAGTFAGLGTYTNFDVLDARDPSDQGAGDVDSFELTANDIQTLVNEGSSSTLTLRLDAGDTFTAVTGAGTGGLNVVNTINTATNAQYVFYSDAGTSNLAATLNVTFGIV